MQAITVKYLGATNTKGVRIKAYAGAGAITEGRDYGLDCSEQSRLLAERYANDKFGAKVGGFGQLPNGDYVATLI